MLIAVAIPEKYVVRHHRLRPVATRMREIEVQVSRLRREPVYGLAGSNELAALTAEPTECRKSAVSLAAAVAEVADASNTVSHCGQPNRYMRQSAVTYAIATPCSDGKRLYAWLPMGGNMLVFSGRDVFIHAGSRLYCVRE